MRYPFSAVWVDKCRVEDNEDSRQSTHSLSLSEEICCLFVLLDKFDDHLCRRRTVFGILSLASS